MSKKFKIKSGFGWLMSLKVIGQHLRERIQIPFDLQ